MINELEGHNIKDYTFNKDGDKEKETKQEER